MKYIIKDWADNEMLGLGEFKSFDMACEALNVHCESIVRSNNPEIDLLSDAFGSLMDIECGEYVIAITSTH